MHDLGLTPSRHTYSGLIKAVITGKGVTHGMDLVPFSSCFQHFFPLQTVYMLQVKIFLSFQIKIMEHKGLQPHDCTLASISVGYSKILELDLAESFFERISDKFPYLIHPFNALLVACDIMVTISEFMAFHI